MHLLATQTAGMDEAGAAIDLEQSPADIVALSFSDSDLSAVAAAAEIDRGLIPELRLASLKKLKHPMSVDLYIERVISGARAVIVRCLGGLDYWRYGIERIGTIARAKGIFFAALPGDDRPDPRLAEFCAAPAEAISRLDAYFREGGVENIRNALRFVAASLGRDVTWREPQAMGAAVALLPGGAIVCLNDLHDAQWGQTHGSDPEHPLIVTRDDRVPSPLVGKGQGGGEPQRMSWFPPPPGSSPGQALTPPHKGEGDCVECYATELRNPLCTPPVALVLFYRANLLAADTAPISALVEALEAQGLAALAVAVTSLKDPAAGAALSDLLRARPPAVILNTTAFSAMRDNGATVLDASEAPVLQVVLSGSTREAWAASPRGLSPSDLAMNVVLPELDGRILARAISFKEEGDSQAGLQFAAVRHAPDLDRIRYVAQLTARWARLREKPRSERRIALVLSDYPARGGRTGYAAGLDTAESVAEIVRFLADAGYHVGARAITGAAVEAFLKGEADRFSVSLQEYALWFRGLPAPLRTVLEETWGPPESDPSFANGSFVFPALRAGNVTILLQPDRGARGDRKSGYHDITAPPRHAYVALYAALRETENIDALVHLGTHGTLEWLPGKALALSAECWPEAVLGPVPVVYPFIVNNPGEASQAKRRIGAVAIGHLTPPLSNAGLHGGLVSLEALIEEYAAADGLDRRRLALIESEIIDRAWTSGLASECGLVKGAPARASVAKLDARLCDIKELSVRDGLHVFGRSMTESAKSAIVSAIVAGSDGGLSTGEALAVDEAVAACAEAERAGLLAALDGRRVPPGPSGAPSRGRADVLPTGRNLTTIDPRAIPTRTAAAIGERAANEIVRRYRQDHGDYPRSLIIDLWASASLRTGGDDIAQALHYLGARPVWAPASSRVSGVEILPLAKLGGPRIDVTLRISGLFRDLFESQIALFAMAVRRVAARDEDDADNPLAAARRRGESLSRVFGGAPGSYGAGVADVVLDTNWGTREDLGLRYLDGVTHAYGPEAATDSDGFRERVATASALVHPQDDRERDILDGDGAADFAGGFAAAAALLGNDAGVYQIDTSRAEAPRARALAEEISRVARGRLANPRWIAGMLRHGHRGVGEIAQGVDSLYAFAATARAVPGHIFDLTHDALIADAATLAAMIERNPKAAECIALRLGDALERGLWVSRRNAVAEELKLAAARASAAPSSLAEVAS